MGFVVVLANSSSIKATKKREGEKINMINIHGENRRNEGPFLNLSLGLLQGGLGNFQLLRLPAITSLQVVILERPEIKRRVLLIRIGISSSISS